MKTTLIAAALACLASMADAETITVTGQHGGTAVITGSCTRGNGAVHCQSHAVTTGPNGGTGIRDRVTTITPGRIETSVTGTRAGGHSFSRNTVITR